MLNNYSNNSDVGISFVWADILTYLTLSRFQLTFKHVAKTVAGVTLSDHVVDVVYILFDENQVCSRDYVIKFSFLEFIYHHVQVARAGRRLVG